MDRHTHYPNAAGTACVRCGLAAVPVPPEELVRELSSKLRRRGAMDDSARRAALS